MSPPIRETQQDRDREAAIARRLQQSFGWLLVKMPPQYRVDYGIKAEGGEGQLQGFVEVKSRNGYWSDLDGVVFNLGKLYAMRQMAQDVPCFVVIHTRTDDRLHWMQVRPSDQHPIKIISTSHREVDPVAVLGLDRFEEVSSE